MVMKERIVVYDGSKTLWKQNLTVEIYIIKHVKLRCLEIIVFNPQTKKESPRIYVSYEMLLYKCRDESHEVYAEEKKEFSRLQSQFVVDEKDMKESLLAELINQYLVSRIDIHADSTAFLQPSFDDVPKPNTGKIDFEIIKPDHLIPFVVRREVHGNGRHKESADDTIRLFDHNKHDLPDDSDSHAILAAKEQTPLREAINNVLEVQRRVKSLGNAERLVMPSKTTHSNSNSNMEHNIHHNIHVTPQHGTNGGKAHTNNVADAQHLKPLEHLPKLEQHSAHHHDDDPFSDMFSCKHNKHGTLHGHSGAHHQNNRSNSNIHLVELPSGVGHTVSHPPLVAQRTLSTRNSLFDVLPADDIKLNHHAARHKCDAEAFHREIEELNIADTVESTHETTPHKPPLKAKSLVNNFLSENSHLHSISKGSSGKSFHGNIAPMAPITTPTQFPNGTVGGSISRKVSINSMKSSSPDQQSTAGGETIVLNTGKLEHRRLSKEFEEEIESREWQERMHPTVPVEPKHKKTYDLDTVASSNNRFIHRDTEEREYVPHAPHTVPHSTHHNVHHNMHSEKHAPTHLEPLPTYLHSTSVDHHDNNHSTVLPHKHHSHIHTLQELHHVHETHPLSAHNPVFPSVSHNSEHGVTTHTHDNLQSHSHPSVHGNSSHHLLHHHETLPSLSSVSEHIQ